MSQNSHTLLLFFDDAAVQKDCLLMLLRLNEEKAADARYFAERLGLDISRTWQEDWFNHGVSAKPEYIRIDFDSATGYPLPLRELEQLFDCGLSCAALEQFYGQVGEFEQLHFMDRKLVTQEVLFKKYPRTEAIIAAHFEASSDALDEDQIRKPATLKQLIKEQQSEAKFANDMVDMLRNAGKDGLKPTDLLMGTLVWGSIFKGVGQALLFGVVTVLLFKGMWLWISLSLILAVLLPMYYLSDLFGSSDDDADQPEVAA